MYMVRHVVHVLHEALEIEKRRFIQAAGKGGLVAKGLRVPVGFHVVPQPGDFSDSVSDDSSGERLSWMCGVPRLKCIWDKRRIIRQAEEIVEQLPVIAVD